MFNQKKEENSGTTVIAEGVRLEGEFHGQGPMVIEGSVVGTVSTNASIEVGEKARIEADITAASLVVAGRIKGNVTAAERLELLPTARLDGDIVTGRLIVADGAILNGRCSVGDAGRSSRRHCAGRRFSTAGRS